MLLIPNDCVLKHRDQYWSDEVPTKTFEPGISEAKKSPHERLETSISMKSLYLEVLQFLLLKLENDLLQLMRSVINIDRSLLHIGLSLGWKINRLVQSDSLRWRH